MSVTNQTPRNVSTAAAAATVFPYSFKVNSKFDLLVTVDGVTKAVDVDYTVSGVGLDAGGDITFVSPMVGGETVMRKRNMTFQRVNDYQNLGDLRSHTLNNDQDEPVMMIQQLGEAVGRSLKMPADTPINFVSDLPPPAPLSPLVYAADGNSIEAGSTTLTGDMLLRPNLANGLDPAKGAALVAFRLPDAQAVARTHMDKSSDTASIRDFGGVADDATDNASAFGKAEASGYTRIYLPEGTYYATVSSFELTKQYYGPGKLRINGLRGPGRFTQIISPPAKGAGGGDDYYFSGDTSRVEPEYFVLGASNTNVRRSLTERYFESVTTPHFAYFTNYSGASGVDARIPLSTSPGATSVVVNSAASLSPGPVLLYDRNTGASQTATISSIVGTTVNFSPGIVNSLAANSYIANSPRNMQQFAFVQLNHYGAGDAYCHTFRVNVGYTPAAGQDHYFNTSTGGFLGGDINHTTDGTYSTTFEAAAFDNGHDVAHIGHVETFGRNNGTGNYGAVWLGTFFKSEGSAYCDAAHTISGKWKRGLDTVLMTADADKAAINMKADQRIYFDSTATGDPILGQTAYGNTIGDTWLGYSSATNSLDAIVDGQTVVQYTGTAIFFNKAVSFFSAAPAPKQTVTGAKGGNAALASLLTALAAFGLITDSTT